MRSKLIVLIFIALALPLALSRAESQSDEQEYIVAVKNGQSIDDVNNSSGTKTVHQIPHSSIYLVKANASAGDVLSKLKGNKNVDIAENNGHSKLPSRIEAPLDPALVQQAASSLDGQTLTTFYGAPALSAYVNQPAVAITHLDQVRNVSTGAATRVAYVDTGVDFYHPALQPWLDPGIDLINDQSASEMDGLSQAMASLLDQQSLSLLDDRFSFVLNQAMASLLDGENSSEPFPSELGHGTLVAGIIHLVAPEARIVPIKAFDAYGNTTMFTIIEAIYAARDLDVDVLNLSFSLDADSDMLRKALTDARSSGIAIVASVGNNGSGDGNSYPSAYPQVIGVAASDFSDRLAAFSNYGKAVSVVAPGAFVVSTVPGGKYAAAWGTSFSAPIVSGAIALVSSQQPNGLTAANMALNMADSIDSLNPGFERKLGRGRINIQRSLKQ